MAVIKMTDLDLKGKRVLLREDLNVPLKEGRITSDKRIRAALPSIRMAMEAGARVLIVSHLGRPVEGEFDEALSLAPVAAHLSRELGRDVRLVKDYIDGVDVAEGDCVLCENVRFLKGEKKNTEELGRRLAALSNRKFCTKYGISTSFVRKGREARDESLRKVLRSELSKERATRLEGSFGTQKQHYSLARIKARNRKTEILWIFFGIHTANAILMIDKIRNRKGKAA